MSKIYYVMDKIFSDNFLVWLFVFGMMYGKLCSINDKLNTVVKNTEKTQVIAEVECE